MKKTEIGLTINQLYYSLKAEIGFTEKIKPKWSRVFIFPTISRFHEYKRKMNNLKSK